MLKILAFILILFQFVYSDYYTITDTTPTINKTYIYKENIKIKITPNRIKLTLPYDISPYNDNKAPIQYKPIKLNNKVYNVYNLNYILTHNINDKEFILKGKKDLYLIKVSSYLKERTIFNNPINVTEYKFIIKKNISKNRYINQELLTKDVDKNGAIVAISFLGNNIQKLYKIENSDLKKFLQEKQKRKTSLDKLDFSKEKIYATYISENNDVNKRLNVTYSMRKGFVKIVLQSPVSLFDPQNESDNIEQNVGFLKDFRNDLYEVKKVQIVNGQIEVNWLNLPNKRVVIVDYYTDGKKDRSILSKSKNQQFYSIEGVFYLVSWMNKNHLNKKIFTFINGYLPFDVTMKKISQNRYAMQKEGNTIYSFDVNNKNIITKITYPAYNISINLESIDSDTTLANKRYLKNFQQEHNIALIKENK